MDIYRERAHLIAHLATLYPSVLSYSDPDEPDWPVLTIDTPTGQLTWHIAPTDLDLVDHVQVVPLADPRAAWDGHSTNEKYARLRALTKGTLTMHEAPKPTDQERDARSRAVRTLLQGLAVTLLVGAATAVTELATDGGVLTLATVGTAAGTGALMAAVAYVQRRVEGHRE